MKYEHTIKKETLQAVMRLGNPSAEEVSLFLRINISTVQSRLKSLVELKALTSVRVKGANISRYAVSEAGLIAAKTGLFPNARLRGQSIRPPFVRTIYNESHGMPSVQAAMKYQPNSIFDYAARIAA